MGLLAGTIWDREPHCERCDKPESQCQCPPIVDVPAYLPPEKQTARLSTEKRKKGKLVTVISGLTPAGNDLPGLLAKIKSSLGTGGTLEGDELEIQGDQLERVRQFLSKLGFRIKG